MKSEELDKIIDSHAEWISTEGSSGNRADFTIYLGREYWTHDFRKIIIDRRIVEIENKKFENVDLSNSNISSITIKNSEFINSRFIETNFSLSNLTKIIIDNVKFNKCNFENTTISNIDYRKSILEKSNFRNSKIHGSNFDYLNLSEIDFSGSEIADCSFLHSIINSANFNNCIIRNCTFEYSNLESSSFNKSKIYNSTFANGSLHNSNFELSDIIDSAFDESNLGSAKFTRAHINRVSFKNSSLIASLFQGSYLDTVCFARSVLHYTKFTEFSGVVSEVGLDKNEYYGVITKKIVVVTVLKNCDFTESELDYIYISKTDLKFLDDKLIKKFGHTFNSNGNYHNVIVRELTFPRGYEHIGLNILTYFNKILEDQYKDIAVKVTIHQQDHIVTMIIETPDGYKEIIEKKLCDYALVMLGKVPADSLLDDKLQIISLQHQVSILGSQIESQMALLSLSKEMHSQSVLQIDFLKGLLYPAVKGLCTSSINCETYISNCDNIMKNTRSVTVNKGNYIESNDGVYIENFSENDFENFDKYSSKIIELLNRGGSSSYEESKSNISNNISNNIKKDFTLKDKLFSWIKEVSKSTTDDIVKDITKSAIRLAGIPLP